MITFIFYFQETYNSWLGERYGDDPLIHLEFDPDLWMEVGSFGGPDKNRFTGSPTLRPRTCGRPVVFQSLRALNQYRAPNLRSSWSCSNTWLSSPKNTITYQRRMHNSKRNMHNKKRRMHNGTHNKKRIMNSFAKWSSTWHHRVVIHVRLLLFGRITTSLLLLQLHLYVNL